MEFCKGQSIQQDRPEDAREIARIFAEVASALAYMNAAGFVHADMKPNNILVGPKGGVKVIDLGQSCPIGTIKKRIQGTPDFIAPEQVRREPLDERTDVYNFGASLYWTLVGTPIPTVLPKNGGTGVTFLQDLDIQPPHEANPEIPLSISRLTMDCLHLQPRQRLESMKIIADRMELLTSSRALDVTPEQINGGA
jgi:serine/threonine-protein kinase